MKNGKRANDHMQTFEEIPARSMVAICKLTFYFAKSSKRNPVCGIRGGLKQQFRSALTIRQFSD